MSTKRLDSDPDSYLALVQTKVEGQVRLELRKLDEPKLGAVYVDFVTGTMAHRRKYEAVEVKLGVKVVDQR